MFTYGTALYDTDSSLPPHCLLFPLPHYCPIFPPAPLPLLPTPVPNCPTFPLQHHRPFSPSHITAHSSHSPTPNSPKLLSFPSSIPLPTFSLAHHYPLSPLTVQGSPLIPLPYHCPLSPSHITAHFPPPTPELLFSFSHTTAHFSLLHHHTTVPFAPSHTTGSVSLHHHCPPE